MKKRILGIVIVAILCTCAAFISTSAAAPVLPVEEITDPASMHEPHTMIDDTAYLFSFSSAEEVNTYAYMDIESASKELKSTILAARSVIIYNCNWVADEITGQITRNDGTIEVLPKFHELFPSDWDIPAG